MWDDRGVYITLTTAEPLSEGWVTTQPEWLPSHWSLRVKWLLGVQWFPTKHLDTLYCKIILMSCDQLWIAACSARLVLETIKCASLQADITQLGNYGWGWWHRKLSSAWQVSEGYMYRGWKSKSAKKMQRQQDWGWNPPNIIECDCGNHWFHFK